MNFKVFTLLPLVLSTLFVGTNNIDIKDSSTATIESSILNYDDSLGIFKDWTDEEIQEYYGSLEDGLKGDDLLDELQVIISEDQESLARTKVWSSDWSYFKLADRDWSMSPLTNEEIENQTWDTTDIYVNPLYSEDYYITSSTTIGNLFNREHMWPKSRGFKYLYSETDEDGDEAPYAATDMHNLRMGEATNNQSGHNNYPYGNVADKSTAREITDSITGEVTGYRGENEDGITVYEPQDEDKGDIARALFYMATRYHNFVDANTNQPALALVSTYENNTEATDTIICIDTQDSPATYGMLDDLLEWNEEDPVDEFEIHRNNLVCNAIQGNRNPYVDFPEWANVAFGESQYGVDVDAEDGLLKEGLYVTADKNTYYQGNKLNLTAFEFTCYDATGNFVDVDYSSNNLNLEIEYNGSTIEEPKQASSYLDYTFDNTGTYTLIFSYPVDTETYTDSIDITVEPKTYSDGLNVESTKDDYYANETLDLSYYFTFYYYDEYGDRHNISSSDSKLTLEILLDGEVLESRAEASTYDDLIFSEDGTYTLNFEYTLDEDNVLSATYTITVEQTWINYIFSEYGLYILIGLIVLIVIIIIIAVVVSKSSKKKTKSKSKKKK